jgi:hypothetical protein
MPFLRKRDTGAVTDFLENDSVEYLTLIEMRFQSDVTAAGAPSGVTSGLLSGETPGTIKAGQPVWESISEQDAGFPDPSGGRVGVIALGSAATAAAETSSDLWNAEVAGTLTDVEYVPNASITGQATNNRVITLQQVTLSGTSTVTRTVTSLAAVTFGNGVNGTANVAVPMTISTAAFASGSPLQVVSSVNGTGLADPGGVVYFVYTRA